MPRFKTTTHPNPGVNKSMAAKSTQFHIQLDGVTLNAAQTKALAADIDKLVSTHLAKSDFRGDFSVGRPLIINPEWLGIWIRTHGLGDFAHVQSAAELPKTLPGLNQNIG
jgi:hypothetical protein